MSETNDTQPHVNHGTRALLPVSIGTGVLVASYWHAINHGFSLISAPALPWYEYWLPMAVAMALLLYGTSEHM